MIKLIIDYNKTDHQNEYWIFSFSSVDEKIKFESISSMYRLNSLELLKDETDLVLSSWFSSLINSPLGFKAFEKLKSKPGIYTDFDFYYRVMYRFIEYIKIACEKVQQ